MPQPLEYRSAPQPPPPPRSRTRALSGLRWLLLGVLIWAIGLPLQRTMSTSDTWPTAQTLIVFTLGLIPSSVGLLRLMMK